MLLDALRAELAGVAMPPTSLRHRRATAETLLSVRLRVPGEGRVYVNTGEGFYDHMLQQLAFHGGMDLRLEGVGDLETGDHHMVEDMMRTFGEALDQALGRPQGAHSLRRGPRAHGRGDRARGRRPVGSGHRHHLDRRPTRGWRRTPSSRLAQTARITLHVTATGVNAHHVAEASFKAVGRALAQALTRDGTLVRSTKGSL